MYSRHDFPDAISHRGLHTLAPENSIPAFLAAIEAGADGIELDVHASADNVVFVHHNPAIRPAGGGEQDARPIAGLDSSDIATIRLSVDVAIPTLDDVLEVIGSSARVFIEIKAEGIEETVSRCLRRHPVNADNYAVHSFDHRTTKRVLELNPSVRTGVLQVSRLVDSCGAMRAAGASDLWQHSDFIDASLVIDVHACGGRVIAWTPNDESVWTTLAAARVDGICTDRVDAYVGWRSAQKAAAAD
ncbi:MAG: glycerophosphodiester phosphodiesterase family protein [Gemmatimonadaceae bacterium]|nr:glycerophosphodiester phosphodiesterase family protein [Gemmatimonadaceae bacterium]